MKHRIQDLPLNRVLAAPSLLAADFACLKEQVHAVEHASCDLLHLDIMDGHFVPNLTFGPALVKAIRKDSNLLFDAHLMLAHPKDYVKVFSDAGADHITFHVESADDPAETIRAIRESGCSVGISVKPKTPASVLEPFIDLVDLILVMTVEPGFGGQSFMADQLPKIREVFSMLRAHNSRACIQVDGGIDARTAPLVIEAGADVLVSGTGIFRAKEGIDLAVAGLHALSGKLPLR